MTNIILFNMKARINLLCMYFKHLLSHPVEAHHPGLLSPQILFGGMSGSSLFVDVKSSSDHHNRLIVIPGGIHLMDS